MRRQKLRFAFTPDELVKAAKEHESNHARHVEHWQSEADRFNEEMQKTARIEEQPITGGVNRVLRFDQGLQVLVTEAQNRLRNHQNRMREYGDWVIAFDHTTNKATATMWLDHEDVAFFFGPMEAVPDRPLEAP